MSRYATATNVQGVVHHWYRGIGLSLARHAIAQGDTVAATSRALIACTTHWAKRYILFMLEVQRIWFDSARAEQRLVHHQGDGRFSIDSESIDLGERMVKWRHLMGE